MADDLIGKLLNRLKGRPWYTKPRLFAMGDLVEIRNELRQKNLHDTEEPPLQAADPAGVAPALRDSRTTDGTSNDLRHPTMGAVGRRFGRNVPLEHVFPDTPNLLTPSPRVVSRECVTGDWFH